MTFAWRMYQRLARAFPHEFNLAYGADVTRLGEDVMRELAETHGASALIRMLADIAIRVPIEYLSEMRHDMRYALWGMLKAPAFAVVAILSTGIGIGLTTMVYTSKWQVITREIPAAANARRLVMAEKAVSYYYVEQYRDQKSLFSGVAALETAIPFNVVFQGDVKAAPQRVFGQLVSADYFSVLGVDPQRGRVFSSDLDKPGDPAVVVISDRFWKNRLNSSPEAVGQTLRLNGQLATIVGITPKNFNGALAINPSELFVLITSPPAIAPELANDVIHQRSARDFLALMCLAPGVTPDSAEVALDTITRRLDAQDPSAPIPDDKSRRVTLFSAGSMVPLPRNLKSVLAGFFAALMALTMVIACMNLANMTLARAANRRKEVAIRLAVGASRFRIVRQMVSEGILLSLLGGFAGFGLAYLLSVLRSRFMAPYAIPAESDFTPDWPAAVFVFVLAIVFAIGFSLVPALRATKGDLTPSLKQSSVLQMLGYRRFGMRNLLMTAQMVGSLMLLLITGFLVVGINQVSGVQTKFDPRSMYLLSIDPVREGYEPAKAQALFEKLVRQLKAAGGADGVVLSPQPPFSVDDSDSDGGIQFTAQDSHGGSPVEASATEETVGAGYFASLSEPMVAGREFTELDQWSRSEASKTLPAILNESAVRRFFANGNAIGQRVRTGQQSYEVVGVAHDFKNGIGISQPVVYSPLTIRNLERPPADGITIMVRSGLGMDSLSRIRREIALIDPNLTVFNVRTLNDYLEQSRSSSRFAVDTYGGIGLFGLVLAAVGLAGVTGYAVAQRSKEIGIRMALGANRRQVLLLVLREGAALVVVGTLLGFLGAFVLAKLFSALTHVFVEALKVGTDDPRVLVGAPLLLAGLALLACYVPARRATRIDPLKVLREG